METVIFREMQPGEEAAVCSLVEEVFDEWVAPDYEAEGREEFFRFANPRALAARLNTGGFVLLALFEEQIVGMLEFSPPDRIAMLFVKLRNRGIAKSLLKLAIEKARNHNPTLSKITVHSSLFGEAAYERMGFLQTGQKTKDHGIEFIPMELELGD